MGVRLPITNADFPDTNQSVETGVRLSISNADFPDTEQSVETGVRLPITNADFPDTNQSVETGVRQLCANAAFPGMTDLQSIQCREIKIIWLQLTMNSFHFNCQKESQDTVNLIFLHISCS
jgi:hypothetical protein